MFRRLKVIGGLSLAIPLIGITPSNAWGQGLEAVTENGQPRGRYLIELRPSPRHAVIQPRIDLPVVRWVAPATDGRDSASVYRALVPVRLYRGTPHDRSPKRRTVLVGAVLGAAIGAGATALLLHSGGSTALCNQRANQDAMAPRECTGLIAAGGLLGAGAGIVIARR